MAVRFTWLTENLGLKLISLLLAIGFWFYVVGEESVEITKTVPLQIRSRNEKISVVKSSTSFLEVTFQAPRHMLSVMSSAEAGAVHEIDQEQKAGDYSFNVTSKNFQLPAPEIHIAKIFPSFVTVTLDEVIVKKLPIEVDLVGDPAFGYRVDLESIEVDPNAVLVQGPKAVLEKMDGIKTEPIQLVGRIRSFRRRVQVRRYEEVKPLGDGMTEIVIPVKANYAEREFKDVLVKPLGAPANGYYAALEANHVTLVLNGPAEPLNQLDEKNLLAFVDVEGLKGGTFELQLKLVLPSDLTLKGEAPVISVQVNRLKS